MSSPLTRRRGKTATLTFSPADGMFGSRKSLAPQGFATSQTIEASSLLEKFRVIADPLGETQFVTNNRWLYVRGHNPNVRWLPGPSVASVDIKVTDSFSIQRDALVLQAGSEKSSLIQVFDSNTEIWAGWTVSVIPPFGQPPLAGISAQISFDANLRAPGHGECGRRLFRPQRRPLHPGGFVSPAPDESGQNPRRSTQPTAESRGSWGGFD